MVVAAMLAVLALPAASYATEYDEPPTTFEPTLEAQNFAITQERQTVYDTPEYQAELAAQGLKNHEEATREQAGRPRAPVLRRSLLRGRKRLRR